MTLNISNLSKFFGKKQIFQDFSYSFDDTGIYAVTGDSGIGKTTLLRMIAGLDNKYSGKISGGGFKNCSYAFQEYRLFPTLSAINNVVIPNGDAEDFTLRSRAQKILTDLDFSPDDLDLFPSELSGGMKQRISLTRAFLKDTPILLLDEPTKELDSSIREKLYSLINLESKNRLIIIVTHNAEDIEKLNAKTIKL